MALALMSVMVSAQSEKPYPVYCNVVGYNWFGVGKIKVELDMGRFTKGKGESLYEANGKKKKFHTMMSVLNYMGERGWKVTILLMSTIWLCRCFASSRGSIAPRRGSIASRGGSIASATIL